VKIAFGTDLLGELQAYQSGEFGIRAEVLGPLEVIRSASVVAAEVLGMEGCLGTIAPAAYADLLAVNGNPLEDLKLLQDDGAHIALIVKDGQVVKNAM
jgi:imidazolonepropionase-like amidohydrolase